MPGIDYRERLSRPEDLVVARRGEVGRSSPEVRTVLDVQRAAGNRATTQLLGKGGATGKVGPSVQRWNPFSWFTKSNKGGSKPTEDDSTLTISGPRNGRAMGEPPRTRPKILPMFEFEQDPRRRRIFAEWARQQKQAEEFHKGGTAAQFDNSKMTEDILRVDFVLSPFQSLAAPSYEDAQRIVAQLRGSSDPEVQRVIAEQEAKYAPFGEITKLEDAVASEQKYRQKHGGIAMLAGISGIIHYMGNDLYTRFYETPGYGEAVGLPPLPPVPSREGRPQLSGSLAPSEDAPEPIMPRGRVAELAGQLGGVIGGVRPGQAPPQPRSGAPSVGLGPESSSSGASTTTAPVAKVVLQERQDPRATERKILGAIARGEKVPPELLTRLGQKIGKGQTTSRGREVTTSTEAEYFEIASKLSPEERAKLKSAASDYTNTSTQINKLARGMKTESDPATIQHQLDNLDSVFSMLDQKGLTEKRRIVYRVATYQGGQKIPYGDSVQVGDIVGDKAYVSTSENRQLLQEGGVTRKAGTRLVKFTIIGTGGANISGGGQYTNENAKAMKRMYGLKGPHSVGQAEILFRRGSLFRIDSITVFGEDVHVVATRVDASEIGSKGAKNAFSGEPLSIT